MKCFCDATGRSWNIELTIGSVKRVRDLLGVNLCEPEAGDPPLLTRLGTDEILLCDVIFCLCKPQADAIGISDAKFGEAMSGGSILQAQTALYEELVDFFRQRGRMDRASAIQTQKKAIELAVNMASEKIAGLNLQEQLEKAMSSS